MMRCLLITRKCDRTTRRPCTAGRTLPTVLIRNLTLKSELGGNYHPPPQQRRKIAASWPSWQLRTVNLPSKTKATNYLRQYYTANRKNSEHNSRNTEWIRVFSIQKPHLLFQKLLNVYFLLVRITILFNYRSYFDSSFVYIINYNYWYKKTTSTGPTLISSFYRSPSKDLVMSSP